MKLRSAAAPAHRRNGQLTVPQSYTQLRIDIVPQHSRGGRMHIRALLAPDEWRAWLECIVNTISRTATVEGSEVNWRAYLLVPEGGETLWSAGLLTKGSNLCHGTGGNGYAFLKLHQRTGDSKWLDRARAFAFEIYLWQCLHGTAAFPTLDVF
jgi:hypothetical protein